MYLRFFSLLQPSDVMAPVLYHGHHTLPMLKRPSRIEQLQVDWKRLGMWVRGRWWWWGLETVCHCVNSLVRSRKTPQICKFPLLIPAGYTLKVMWRWDPLASLERHISITILLLWDLCWTKWHWCLVFVVCRYHFSSAPYSCLGFVYHRRYITQALLNKIHQDTRTYAHTHILPPIRVMVLASNENIHTFVLLNYIFEWQCTLKH